MHTILVTPLCRSVMQYYEILCTHRKRTSRLYATFLFSVLRLGCCCFWVSCISTVSSDGLMCTQSLKGLLILPYGPLSSALLSIRSLSKGNCLPTCPCLAMLFWGNLSKTIEVALQLELCQKCLLPARYVCAPDCPTNCWGQGMEFG